MTTLYLDAFSGASGNMLLGCLLDLGVSRAQLQQAIEEMQLDGCSLAVTTVQRTGILLFMRPLLCRVKRQSIMRNMITNIRMNMFIFIRTMIMK